ncbi:nucleotidyltransferase [Clostridium algidicarnis]|uniref:nucleotidyltransferase n=1 Tax=Clostridium algidicarnis TaxID=37659 RepID=UPI001C0B1ACE|nr:nucleotidyltransferase [Clostridium algidicarnis]MBU3197388.1 nucleotidyltransferase [Clostridium algidicarnis]
MILFSQIDDYYEELYKELDIPETYYEKANTSYTSFNSWLDRDDSTLKEFEPETFLQGSFKLGTVIKPIGENDSYDIDMVCKFNNLSKQTISQKDLKTLLGKEVESYAKSKSMVHEPKNGKRCWTLNYHDEAKFHMDILPCVDDSKKFIMQLEALEYAETTSYKEKAVAITDKRSKGYEVISNEWEISNPKGYYLWFQEKSKFIEKRYMLAEQFQMNAEELKEYKVKTPLQKTIQILKRHRDIMFQEKIEKRPSSIIISTLSAKAYRGGDNLRDVLKYIVENMARYIEEVDGQYKVLNPVNPIENFADKWNEDQTLKNHFDAWLKEVKRSLTPYNESIKIYGEEFKKKISEQLGISEKRSSELVSLKESTNSLVKFSNSIEHRQKTKWIMLDIEEVKIKALKSKQAFRLKSFVSGEILSKNTILRFEAQSENIKQYDVYWQITNTGYEAENSNCLRGDFYDGQIIEGKKVREESALYSGTHLAECYLVKENICYGKSEPFVVNITDRFTLDW